MSDSAPSRVIFVGDVHGNAEWFRSVVAAASARRCDVIVQCGDFGYWEHAHGGPEYLDACADVLQEADLTCLWIDGNHENHTVLRLNYGPGGNRFDPTPEGFWTIRPRLLYVPRGTRWAWGGVRFLGLGGAYSIDKEYRTEGRSWWPEETLTDAEVAAASEGGDVDVMVTHDAPWGAEGVFPIEGTWDRKKDAWPESVENRKRLRQVFDAAKPRLLVHGHYHHRNSTTLDGCRVEGLGRDGDPDALLVIDFEKDDANAA